MKIVKSLSEISAAEIESGGLSNYCSWERLKPYLDKAAAVKRNERITGIIADENGITIRIETIKP